MEISKVIINICKRVWGKEPDQFERCSIGQGNYVYFVQYLEDKFIVRFNEGKNLYKESMVLLNQLTNLELPVPQIIASGSYNDYEFLVLSYIEGKDIGVVYSSLSKEEKRHIAQQIVHIQDRVAELQIQHLPHDWKWYHFVEDMLSRAESRIINNGYFDSERVLRLRTVSANLMDYFTEVKPTPYLDDISTKNILINHGELSGIIDIDWIGIGDQLTYVAMTYIALLNSDLDTDYVSFIIEEMKLSKEQKRVFLFYSLMYCVDFMGERGSVFMDKEIEVDEKIVFRLNTIFDRLWVKWKLEG